MDGTRVCAGALIERGEVLTAAAGRYTVKSLDRDGILTPPVPAFSGTYAPGDRVYFFLFPDGTGAVLSAMNA